MAVTKANTTQVPNSFFDDMCKMKEAELRVMLCIIRKTRGWHKDRDRISLSQLVKMTGMSKAGVQNGIKDAIKNNHIAKISTPKGSEFELVEVSEGGNVVVQRGQLSSTAGGQLSSHTKETYTKETIQKKNQVKNKPILFNDFLKDCKEKEVEPIPESNSIFGYASKAGIEQDHLKLCWLFFKDKYSEDSKRYKDWPIVFGKAVKNNWFRLWYIDGETGRSMLTTLGKQSDNALRAK